MMIKTTFVLLTVFILGFIFGASLVYGKYQKEKESWSDHYEKIRRVEYKAIAMKPFAIKCDDSNKPIYRCYHCSGIVKYGQKYCCNCGSAIDWRNI